jgi:polyisoprenoid-binding protein YceI
MKTRNIVLLAVAMLSTQLLVAQKHEVNAQKSSVEWLGKKIGGQHNGAIMLKSGSIELKDNQIVSGNFVVDMTSITCADLKDEGYNQKLVGHLKSDDFFGVEAYPTASFKLTESSKFSDGKASVKGDITIKGKTESITFDVVKKGSAYSAKIEIDRSKFDVKYGSNSFFDNLGDKAIDDIFTLTVMLAVK